MDFRHVRAVITEDVEKQLLETAALSMRMNLPIRCVHLALSALPNYTPQYVSAVAGAVADGIEDHDAVIYIAPDRDIFVISRLATRKTLLRLLRGLPGELVPAPEQSLGLASLFELHVEGHRLEAVFAKKRQQAQQKVDQEKPEVVTKEAPTVAVLPEMDLAKDLASHVHLVPTIAARRNERRNPSVLFVEDDVFSQKLLGNALRSGYEVCGATTGYEGVMSYLKIAPDIVFLDINLPDMMGIEILEKIFSLDPRAFVVMLSGNGHKDNVMKAIQGGARGFIGKPFTIDKLQQYLSMCPTITEKKHARELNHG
jgi:two-component system, chemotaxis family, chemotaxis protein CheY